MPKIYQFDDFDDCIGRYAEESIYCIARAHIKPDPNSENYRIIEKFSSNNKRDLRHDKLQFGICLNHCRKFSNGSINNTQSYDTYKHPKREEVKSIT